jgi:N-hydroxyarylamine O-acetyltransferase
VIDIDAYFRRIGITERPAEDQPPDLDLLRRLVLAHTRSIAFENLNTLMRVPVRLDLDSLEAKLVCSARGGYCFEQNTYFAAVLEQIGFSVKRLAARVVWGRSAEERWQNPRTHMALLVHVAGETWLCDVGFGGITPTAPLLFEPDREQRTPHETFRIVEREEVLLLQVRLGADWLDVYLFDLQPQSHVDYEMANHYVATHPESHFRHSLIAARPFEGGRYALRNRLFTTFITGGSKHERMLEDGDEIVQVLHECFRITVRDLAGFHAALDNIRED